MKQLLLQSVIALSPTLVIAAAFTNLDFENMGDNGFGEYTSDSWSIQYGTFPDKRINSYNFGFASEAFLQRGFIDYTIYGPSLAHLDGRIIQGNNSYFLWGMAPERYSVFGGAELELTIADLYQVGSIPSSANSIVFKYRNDWPELFVGGVSTPLVEIMPGVLSGSVQSVKGTEAEIRFRANPEKYVMFDAISFSTRVVPEPTSSLLFLLSAAGLFCHRARRKVSPP
jgi:hypothetical protein